MFLLFWKIYFLRKKGLKIRFSGNVPGKRGDEDQLKKEHGDTG
jgi:hypothetical protein